MKWRRADEPPCRKGQEQPEYIDNSTEQCILPYGEYTSMKIETYNMIKCALDKDGDLTPEERKRMLKSLKSYNDKEEKFARLGRILKGTEVAKRLNLSTRTIRNYRKQGLILPFCPKGRKNATGYLESEVDAFLASHGVSA